MPVSPLTPLSLTASVNLHRLRDAFNELEEENGFYVDPGAWCCRTCATSDAWKEGPNQPYVFWHEQNEDSLHSYPKEAMPLYYGVARSDASDSDRIDTARKIIKTLEKHGFKSDWEDGDIEKCIFVHLDAYKPSTGNEDEFDDDLLNVNLYLPKNEETNEYCMNESNEDFGEPKDTYSFCQRIADGESLKDAALKVPPEIRKYITHYQRGFNDARDSVMYPVESILEIDSEYGHSGGISLEESMEDEEGREDIFLQAIDDCYLHEVIESASEYKLLIEQHIDKVASLYCEGNEMDLKGCEPYWLIHLFDANNARYVEHRIKLEELTSDTLKKCMKAIEIPISAAPYVITTLKHDNIQGINFDKPFKWLSLSVYPEFKYIRLQAHLDSSQKLDCVRDFCSFVNTSPYILKSSYSVGTGDHSSYNIAFTYDLLCLDQGGVGIHTLAKAVKEFVFSIVAAEEEHPNISLDLK